ncbi:glycerophosphodiester phosphodiesterase [Ornithinibacillus sp. L9]|uniref:Glycerophosphodiester phosphodiesterase n=1 Tax=Ornithinibacillus caprae TaxID=2678566 RepID=A0A6N8FDE6_9BACI|nr:glycerophosphodiester phosphodiesterase [Ornithinibacillus caprae]MUK87201.1 glycerophosphodiester phosphodiesterase [Ornithinibacillus caprae]
MVTKVIAHRGASKYAPENTMSAFELAVEMGADGIETDVQLTKDHIPVLIHDENVKRTTNGTGLISQLTFKQVKQLDAGAWFHPSFSGATILSLDEFLQWFANKSLYLNIELKNNKIEYKNIEAIVYEMLGHHKLLNRSTISTFNPNSIKRMKSYRKNLEVAFLTSKRYRNLVQLTKELGGNALHIKYRLLNRPLVEHIHQENMAVRVYTINKTSRMLNCYQHECDGIFTDIPDKAKHVRKLVFN